MTEEDTQNNASMENNLPQEMVETTDLPPDSPVYHDLQEQRKEILAENGEQKTLKISCHACGQKLDLTNFPAFSKVKCPACETELIVPKWFDNYLLEETAGEGGMAIVYRALDLALDREVAIKVLSSELGSQQDKSELFLHEARTAATINHYAVVPIYTCGIHEGQTYIVMQYMSGGSLEDLLEKSQEPLPLLHIASWIRDAATGLQNACEHGIIHHDIKPANIMLDQEGKAKICDFGIAQIINGNKTDSTTELTSAWVSPHYVSPEKIVNGSEDYRGDIYSLGATFYHLVTGTTPFTENDIDELLRLRVNNDPVAPMCHRKDLPESLSNFILSMMAREPENRPSYVDIIKTLDKFINKPAGRPAGAKRPAGARRTANGKTVGAAAVAQQVIRQQKAAKSPAVVALKVLSQILTVLLIFIATVWLLHTFDKLNSFIDKLPRFMQASKKKTDAETKLNTTVLNDLHDGFPAVALENVKKILDDPEIQAEYKYQAMLQAAFAAYLNTDLRTINDGKQHMDGKRYTSDLFAIQNSEMSAYDKIVAEDNFQLLQFLAGSYGELELESGKHFERAVDFNLKLTMSKFLITLLEEPDLTMSKRKSLLKKLKQEMENCKESWLYYAFYDRLPFWEQAMLSECGRLEEIEPIFRKFIGENDKPWAFRVPEMKQKHRDTSSQKQVITQTTEEGDVIGGPTISMERIQSIYTSNYAELGRPQPKNPPLPYEFFFTKRRCGDYINLLQSINPHMRVVETNRLNAIQQAEKFLRELTEKEPIEVGEIQMSMVEQRRRVMKTYQKAKMSFTEFNIKIAYVIVDDDDNETEAHVTLDWNCFPWDSMLKILIAAAEKRSAQPKKTLEEDGRKGVVEDEKERAAAWLNVAHWAHWYGDLDTVLMALKKIQMDTMGRNNYVNQQIEYFFLKDVMSKLKPKTEEEE